MKKAWFVIFCIFMSVAALAQTASQTITVKGTVVDSITNKPLGYVTVALLDDAHQPVKSAITKEDGSFEVKASVRTTYQLTFASVGYQGKILKLNGQNGTIDAGKVLLSPSENQLKEVAISGVRPIMKQEIDRISYDVQADPDSKGLSVLDIIRKVPLLSVDGNNNILLKGSGNYKILINGKESALMVRNPSDILNAMPATNIEKIEVITTPPAKYDAEGLSGIINIITKRNVGQGYTLALNTRVNSVFGPGANINGTYKQGKFGVSLIFGGGANGNTTTGFGNNENIFASQSAITQTGTNHQVNNLHFGTTELSYEIDSLNLLTVSVNLFATGQTQNILQASKTDSLGISQQGFNLMSSGYNNFVGVDASINYQLGFKKSKEELLTFSYKYSNAPTSQFTGNIFSDRFNYPLALFPDYNQYNNSGNKDHTIQIDYAAPLTKTLSVEAGAKAILRNNFSNYNVNNRDTVTQQYVADNALTNDFNYHQDIYSLYNSYDLKMDKWAAKAGLRLERTDISADFISAGVTTTPSYNNLIPSVSIERTFEKYSLDLGFTQRIQRPGILQLNPFVDRSNPNFVVTGNPSLRPELDNTFDLIYSNFSKAAINIDLSYAFSNNSIQNVSSLQVQNISNKSDTVTYTTFQNLGTNKTLGLNVNTNMTITKQFTLGLNGQVNYVWLSGSFNGSNYHNEGITGNAFGNMRYKLGNGYAITFNAGYFSGQVNLQGKSNDFIFNQYLFSKDFFDRKMTIVLVANDPYSKYYTSRSTINATQFYQASFNQNYYRSLAVRFNFRIGKLKGDIKRNEHGIENNDIKTSGKTPVVTQ